MRVRESHDCGCNRCIVYQRGLARSVAYCSWHSFWPSPIANGAKSWTSARFSSIYPFFLNYCASVSCHSLLFFGLFFFFLFYFASDRWQHRQVKRSFWFRIGKEFFRKNMTWVLFFHDCEINWMSIKQSSYFEFWEVFLNFIFQCI